MSGQSDKIKNATHSRRRASESGGNRGVSERWENLGELGHLSQMYPCTFPDPPQGTDSRSRWGLVNSMRVTASCGLSAEGVRVCVGGFVFFPLLHEALHTSAGVKVHNSLNLVHPQWPSHMGLWQHNVIKLDSPPTPTHTQTFLWNSGCDSCKIHGTSNKIWHRIEKLTWFNQKLWGSIFFQYFLENKPVGKKKISSAFFFQQNLFYFIKHCVHNSLQWIALSNW